MVASSDGHDIVYAEFVVWTLQSSIKDGIEMLKTFDLNGKIIIDTTNIVYKVDDENSVINTTSSTEMARLVA